MQIGWPGLGICCTILILWSIFLSVFCLSACKLMICPSLVARFPEEACQRWTHSAVPRPSTPHTCQLWASKFQKVMQFLVKFFYIHILWLKRPTPLPPSIPEIPKIDHWKLFSLKAIYTISIICPVALYPSRKQEQSHFGPLGSGILEVNTLVSTAYFEAFPVLLSINGNKAEVETAR